MSALDIAFELHLPGLGTCKLRHLQHRIALELLHTHLLHLGARAWQEFRRQGRGLLVVDPERWLHVAAERSGQGREAPDPPAEYVPAEAVAEAFGADGPLPHVRLLTETYDPQRTFVLAVRHPEEAMSVLLIRLAAPNRRRASARPHSVGEASEADDGHYRHRPVVLPLTGDPEAPVPGEPSCPVHGEAPAAAPIAGEDGGVPSDEDAPVRAPRTGDNPEPIPHAAGAVEGTPSDWLWGWQQWQEQR